MTTEDFFQKQLTWIQSLIIGVAGVGIVIFLLLHFGPSDTPQFGLKHILGDLSVREWLQLAFVASCFVVSFELLRFFIIEHNSGNK